MYRSQNSNFSWSAFEKPTQHLFAFHLSLCRHVCLIEKIVEICIFLKQWLFSHKFASARKFSNKRFWQVKSLSTKFEQGLRTSWPKSYNLNLLTFHRVDRQTKCSLLNFPSLKCRTECLCFPTNSALGIYFLTIC